MPRFRPRFTVRRLMIAVAIVGLIAGALIDRSKRYRAMAAEHRMKAVLANQPRSPDDCPFTFRGLVHRRLAMKYERAARYPWLPIAPDPREPE